jgi:carbon starvation protein
VPQLLYCLHAGKHFTLAGRGSLNRKREVLSSVNALPLLLIVLGIFIVAYRYYGALIASKAFALDDRNITPAHRFNDGHNYVPSPRWVVFGHHFAAIAGAGPLVGPTLAAQFGFAPGLLWLVAGAVLAGAVHDVTALIGSIRHDGRSLPHIVLREVGPTTGVVAMIAVVINLIIAMAGLAIVVVNALSQSPWGVFTIGMTVPIAFIMGWWMFKSAPGRVRVLWPSVFGVIALASALIAGHWFAASSSAAFLQLSGHQIALILCAYGFCASVLPVWMLLEPRDYLSTYIKLGTIAALILGVLIVHPTLRFPAFTPYVHGGGPIIPGKLFPFLFVTIACGAISGFHSLVASGTTPKLIDKETQARFIGYGAMLAESLVGVLALIAACSLNMGDYFAINVPPAAFAKLGLSTVNLAEFSRLVGEPLAGRTGGAVSLAVGMAQIFRGIPGMARLTSYWFHFAILFEAMFILTTIDAGTRVARYVMQELMGKIHKPLASARSLPANLGASAFIVLAWGYLVWGGSISTIWPLFGTANQLMAAIALTTMTTFLVNHGRAAYAWITAVPAVFVLVTTITAAVLSTLNVYWPMAHRPGSEAQGWVQVALMSTFVFGSLIIIVSTSMRCILTLRGVPPPSAEPDPFPGGQAVTQPAAPMRCC